MSTQNIHVHDKIGKNPKISLNICFLEPSEDFPIISHDKQAICFGILKSVPREHRQKIK